uniref:hypothetical protein n=1 Tax=Ningiella ruwaisensis TaxID=2364274 RepID=UPI0010A05818|nr:hypothetical protein [Ningiella ruwaisensis]
MQKPNSSSFVITFIIAALAFSGGYLLGNKSGNENGNNSLLEHVDDQDRLLANDATNNSAERGNTGKKAHAWDFASLGSTGEEKITGADAMNNDNSDLASKDEQNNEASEADSPAEIDSNEDVVLMLNALLALSEPNSEEEMQMFTQAIDELRQVLANSPSQLATLMDYLLTLDFESNAFHYATSIIQGLPEQKGYEAMDNLALQLSQFNDPKSRQQFMHLVRNSYNSTNNPEIVNGLVDIALYSAQPMQMKMDALDLIMPYQVSDVERQQIVDSLNSLLEERINTQANTNNNDLPIDNGASYESYESADESLPYGLINHVLRFSDTQQREQLANRLIQEENDLEARYSILDGIHTGVIPRSGELKNKLFSIATDPSDPLQDQAKHALLYVFDISNQEYQALQNQP